MLLWCSHIWIHLTEVSICPCLSSNYTVSCKCGCLRKVIMVQLVFLEPVVTRLCVWHLEVISGEVTTLVQVRKAQCRLIKAASPCPTAKKRLRQGFDWSTMISGWSTFSKHLFHQQDLPLQKFKCFAEVCPFWSQIGEGNQCLSSAHSYCLSSAEVMLKSMLCPLHN